MRTLLEDARDWVRKHFPHLDLAEEGRRSLLFETRDHGSVGEEMPGPEDVAYVGRAIGSARRLYPSLKWAGSVVDEWVMLEIVDPDIEEVEDE